MKLTNKLVCTLISLTVLLCAINLSYEANLKNNKKTQTSMAVTKTASMVSKFKDDIVVKDYKKAWERLFTTGDKRPGHVCANGLKIIFFKPFKKIPTDLHNGFLPKKKQNPYYQKFGYEDAAYFFDYVDGVFQKKISDVFKEHWKKAKSAPEDEKVKNLYDPKEQLLYFKNNGAKIAFDIEKESDPKKLISALKTFEPWIDPSIMADGIKMNQLPSIYKTFGVKYNPGIIGWAKKDLDEYDFNGDGTWSAEEFLFNLIRENATNLDHPAMFKDVTSTLIDPIFNYLDCDSDGLIFAEGLWLGLKELIRPDNDECNIYECVNPKTKLPIRTASINDVVLKNAEEAEGYLNIHEFRKAILLGYWDRQVNNNNIVDDNSMNQKELRWVNRRHDIRCSNGNTIR